MRKSLVTLLGGLSAVCVWLLADAAEQPNENAVKAFMRGKLDASENVLEGLVTQDFEKIRGGADQMRVMSQQAAWNVFQTPQYVQHSAEFQRHAKALGAAAERKNLEAAALAYTQLTLTCINCHRHMRGAKITETENRNGPVIGSLPAEVFQ